MDKRGMLLPVTSTIPVNMIDNMLRESWKEEDGRIFQEMVILCIAESFPR